MFWKYMGSIIGNLLNKSIYGLRNFTSTKTFFNLTKKALRHFIFIYKNNNINNE